MKDLNESTRIERPNRIDLRNLTPARVARESTGVSVTTREALEFSLAHALARDAVHAALAVTSLLEELRTRGLDALAVKSAARDRMEYLRRPDLGRTLAPASASRLAESGSHHRKQGMSLSIVLADGLSAVAVERHAVPLLDALLPLPGLAEGRWTLAPVVVAEQARVALGDEIGAALGAGVTLMLIGERPGLSSPTSLGAYITWAPRPGRTDAERNCVSNIHSGGLDYAAAATKILWFLTQAQRLGGTGVSLRDNEQLAAGDSIPE